MRLLDKIWELARNNVQRVVLPEGNEERTIKATEIVLKEKIADVLLVGNENDIRKHAKDLNVNIDGATIVDPKTSEKYDEYVNLFFELRKNKGMTLEKAKEIIKDEMYFGTMMLKCGDADGLVSGAVHTTADLLRPGMQIIKTSPGTKIVSSFFIMDVPNREYGENGIMFFADSAVNPNPTSEELACIAISTADNARALAGILPKVALLSFSSMGSAKHELVYKVVEASRIANELRPDLLIEGELQLDTAIVPEVCKSKAPNSKLEGKANILIFPDLQSGNIGYKLVQRLANAEAIGPICQGFAKPLNDLSRGCSVSDIVNMVAVTSVQSQSKN